MSLTAVRTQRLFIFALRKTKRSTFSANRHVHVLRMSGSRESLSLRLQAGTSERRPRSDYSVYARLFGRIRMHYSAYYSDRIEYE